VAGTGYLCNPDQHGKEPGDYIPLGGFVSKAENL
jgi:hypothetical protein